MATKKGKTRLFIRIIFLIHLIFASFYLLSNLAPFISPAAFWPLAFFGIAYPVLFLLNFIFLIFWLIFKRKFAIFAGLILLPGSFNSFKFFQVSHEYNETELVDAPKVISFNVRNFDLYNYGKHWEHNFTKKNQIFKFLDREQPDILCFQEYVYDKTNTFNTSDTLKQFLKAKNAHIYFTTNNRNLNFFGIATYTSYPIIDTGSVVFKSNTRNVCIYTDVLLQDDTVRIYNAHLESIRLEPEDHYFLENYDEITPQAKKKLAKNKEVSMKESSEKILKRLKRAYILRAPQADLIAEHIKICPYPVILCGDFNDTPVSYSYHKISSKLKDAFVESGSGLGQSYAGFLPAFRIDYIMYSKDFRSFNYETVFEEMSDHYPVKCYVKLKN